MQNVLQNKTILGIFGVILLVVFLVGSYIFTSQPQQSSFPKAAQINAQDHVKWSPAKKVVLVEYSDFQCPACKMLHELIQQEIEKNPEGKDIMANVTFVYRHFPLTNIHKNALQASYAAEAAANQGKFFEMSNLLFNTQNQWVESENPKPFFIELAKKLKLNTDTFQKDMQSDATKNRVQQDIVSGEEVQVSGTPSLYINGRKFEITSIDQFKQALLTEAGSQKEKK